MRAAGQEFLLGLAGVSATLLGTFIVGVFFYIELTVSDLLERPGPQARHATRRARVRRGLPAAA